MKILRTKKKKTLYIHIGTEKTGTTAVQSTLYLNKELLRQHSINYPSIGYYDLAQFSLVSGLIREEYGANFEVSPTSWSKSKEEEWNELIKNIEKSDCSKHIVCVEHFSSRLSINSIKWIKCYLKNNLIDKINIDVKIICYVRRQDEYLTSSFSTAVKAGDGRTFLEYKDSELHNIKRYDHYKMISNWSDVFGKDNIILRVFERNKLYGGDIVLDVLDCLGLDAKNLKMTRSSDQDQVNESWHPKTIRLAIFVNRNEKIKHRLGERRVELLNRINSIFLKKYPDMGTKYMNRETCMQVIDIYSYSNSRLAKEFFDDGSLFGEKYPDMEQLVKFDSVELYDAMDVIFELLSQCNPSTDGL